MLGAWHSSPYAYLAQELRKELILQKLECYPKLQKELDAIALKFELKTL